MASQLNIKDPETIRLARAQASRTGKSVTAVIRDALERQEVAREADIAARWARVQEITAEFRASLPEEFKHKTSKEMMDDLYDDDGSFT